MFELAATAGSALVDDSQTRTRGALSSVVMAAPVTLPDAHTMRVAQLVLHNEGSFDLVTAAAHGSRESRHCWGRYSRPAATLVESQHRAASSTLPWLNRGAASPPPAATVAGSVTAGRQHASGYLMHPSILDATLHLSAAAAAPEAAQRIRVPSSLATLRIPLQAPQGSLTPLATPLPAAADGSVTCSFSLSSAAAGALQLCSLVIKEMPVPVRPRQAAKEDSAPALAPATAQLVYEAVWQASKAARGGADQPTALQPHTILHPRALRREDKLPLGASLGTEAVPSLSAHEELCIDALTMLRAAGRDSVAMAVAAAATHVLELLRRCLPAASTGATLRLLTHGASPANGSASGDAVTRESNAAAGAALAAIMRVVATEHPGIRVQGLDAARTHHRADDQHGSQVSSTSVATSLPDVPVPYSNQRSGPACYMAGPFRTVPEAGATDLRLSGCLHADS